MRSARFHAETESELQAEATYYEQHTKGLGERFALEVEAAVRVVLVPVHRFTLQVRHTQGLPEKVSVLRGLRRAQRGSPYPCHRAVLQEARLLAQPAKCRLTHPSSGRWASSSPLFFRGTSVSFQYARPLHRSAAIKSRTCTAAGLARRRSSQRTCPCVR